MRISLIVAHTKNRVIGKNNTIPWKLPSDMKWFKETTTGKTVVMGFNTFKSIGKPLPNRLNIVLTSKHKEMTSEHADKTNLVFLPNMESLFELIKSPTEAQKLFLGELVCIGGEAVYGAFLPLVDTMYLTEIQTDCDGEVSFPEFKKEDWVVEKELVGVVDEKSYLVEDMEKKPLVYSQCILRKKQVKQTGNE